MHFIAISDRTSTQKSNVLTWLDTYGWTVPTGLDNTTLRIFSRYQEIRDTVMIVGRDGKISFRKGYNTPFVPQLVNQAIEEARAMTPVEADTWGGIKSRWP